MSADVSSRPLASRPLASRSLASGAGGGQALPQHFAFQYVGLLIFMIGDGVEVGYLSPFIVSLGFTPHFSALMFTVYGVSAAIAAAAAGVLCDAIGSRAVVVAGLVAWLVPHTLFLAFAIPERSGALLLLCYGLRGFGYPLVAYAILTLLMRDVRPERRGLASGVFWFCFSCGLPVLGTVVAGACLPRLGSYGTLWVGYAAVLAGGAFALGPVLGAARDAKRARAAIGSRRSGVRALLAVARENPALVLLAVARAINSSATHGIIVFMPMFFTHEAGMARSQWLLFLELVFVSNIVCNVAFGLIGDATSWARTVIFVGGVGCGISAMAMYWVPLLYGRSEPLAVYATGVLFGLTLAGYVPLSAMAPSLLPGRPGVAMSFLNFGAGNSVWLGPAVVYAVQPRFGDAGVLTAFSALFFFSAVVVARIGSTGRRT